MMGSHDGDGSVDIIVLQASTWRSHHSVVLPKMNDDRGCERRGWLIDPRRRTDARFFAAADFKIDW
jgi:hypothetical protein